MTAPSNPTIPIVVEGEECMQIPLTKGFYCIIDKDDYPLISQCRWQAKLANRFNKTPYAHSGATKRPDGTRNTERVLMHRFILGLTKNDPDVDHRNGNGLDNRRCNLRLCSSSQNAANQEKHRYNTSGFKGVVLRPSGKWAVRLMLNGKFINRGGFSTAEAAARAYDDILRSAHGEFARLNFPDR